MPRYMETAAQANVVATQLLQLIPEESRPQASVFMAQLVNFGVRCARATHRTVRLNAVQRAVKGLPVTVRMKEVKDAKTGKTFNALECTAIGVTAIEGADADDE